MGVSTKIILALLTVDAIIIAVFYSWLRSTPPMDEKALSANGVGLFMFVVQAVFCSRGVFLIVQLATIVVIFALCWLHHVGKISKASVVAPR
jgi:hypothetical protein